MTDTRIFVCCHGPSRLPQEYSSDPYTLIGAGGYRSDVIKLSDNTGDNIAEYNRYLNEMTVIYWVARNFDRIPDYIGFAMYRHHLACSPYSCEPNKIVCNEIYFGSTVRKQFEDGQGKNPMEVMVGHIRNEMPEYVDPFLSYIDESRKFYKGNMFIMPKHMFFDYFGFMQRCIKIAIGMVSELDVEHMPQKRICGYLLERMTSFWIWQYTRNGHAGVRGVPMFHFPIARVPLSAPVQVCESRITE